MEFEEYEEEKEITPDLIEDYIKNTLFNDILLGKRRTIRMYTGVGGMDNFEEAMDNKLGYKRIHIGKKPIRILNRLSFIILKNHSGKYYKRFKI